MQIQSRKSNPLQTTSHTHNSEVSCSNLYSFNGDTSSDCCILDCQYENSEIGEQSDN